jgi:acetyltransferase-like isoleucine patch superfamily enzyme
MGFYSQEELYAMGFTHVGVGTRISKRATFYEMSGSLGDQARIDDYAILTGNVSIGARAHVSPFCFLGGTGGKIVMEDDSGMSTHVSIFTKSDDYRDGTSENRGKICGDVIIGTHTILGAQCVVLPGAVVGKNCTIGVGCVVHGALADDGRYVSVGFKSIRLV